MFDADKFIEGVRDRPGLWNKQTKEYSDKYCRDQLWIELGNEMYTDWQQFGTEEKDEKVIEMKNKWRHIRDNYQKHLNQGWGSEKCRKKKYIYADVLDFLQGTLEIRKRAKLIERRRIVDNESHNNCIEQFIVSPVRSKTPCSNQLNKVSQPDTSLNTSHQSAISYPTHNVTSNSSHNQNKKRRTENNSKKTNEEEEGADRAFLMSILPDYRKLNYDQKLDFRLMTLQFFQNIRQQRNLHNNPSNSSQTYYSHYETPSPIIKSSPQNSPSSVYVNGESDSSSDSQNFINY